ISEHALKHRWVRRVSERRLFLAAWGQFLALVAFAAALWFLMGEAPLGSASRLEEGLAQDPAPPSALQVTISPGDVELEKGSRLVVEANFGGRAPAAATLIHRHAGGETTIPMEVGLDDKVFSSLIPKIDTDGRYE